MHDLYATAKTCPVQRSRKKQGPAPLLDVGKWWLSRILRTPWATVSSLGRSPRRSPWNAASHSSEPPGRLRAAAIPCGPVCVARRPARRSRVNRPRGSNGRTASNHGLRKAPPEATDNRPGGSGDRTRGSHGLADRDCFQTPRFPGNLRPGAKKPSRGSMSIPRDFSSGSEVPENRSRCV